MPKTKPAEEVGGYRDIQISNWKPHSKNTLVGFFTAILPSGMVLHSLMLHQKDEARWIGFPGREYVDAAGAKQYSRFVGFRDRAAAARFRDQVLEALDRHLAGVLP